MNKYVFVAVVLLALSAIPVYASEYENVEESSIVEESSVYEEISDVESGEESTLEIVEESREFMTTNFNDYTISEMLLLCTFVLSLARLFIYIFKG